MSKINQYKIGGKKLATTKASSPEHLLILSASFEERCMGVIDSLKSSFRSDNTFLFYNKGFVKRGKAPEYYKSLVSKCKKISNNFETIEIPINDKQHIITELHNMINKYSLTLEKRTITIDITTFPRHELLLMLRYLRMQNIKSKIRLLYTRPKKYGNWLSYGAHEIMAIPSFGGIQIPGRKKLLVILAGYEAERMFRLWEEHEPSKTIIVIGDPPTNKHFLARNIIKANILKNRTNVEEQKASASDPFKFCKKMESILMNHKKEYNIFIAPMNTKIQTVGLFLLAEKYNWFQITTALPSDYNVDTYSSGAEIIYEFYI